MRRRFIVGVLTVVLMANLTFGVTKLTDTKSHIKVKSNYSKHQMYGEPIIYVDTYFDRPYYVYISPLRTIQITTPYPISKVKNSYGALIESNFEANSKLLDLRLLDTEYTGKAPNIIVLFENGKSLLLNLEILSKEDYQNANQLVMFLDAEEDSMYTRDHFVQEIRKLNTVIEEKNELNKELLFHDLRRFQADQTIEYKKQDIWIRLENITAVGNRYYYNLVVEGDVSYILDEPVVLDMQVVDLVFGTVTHDKVSAEPDEIITYGDIDDAQCVSLLFSVDEYRTAFFSTLKIGTLFEFESKVNFSESLTQGMNVFDSF